MYYLIIYFLPTANGFISLLIFTPCRGTANKYIYVGAQFYYD